MPRAKKEGAAEPKRRSRHGCWPCKSRKVKCGEEKPQCLNCVRQGETCDYSIKLNWEGRTKRKEFNPSPWSSEHISLMPTPPTSEVELASGALHVTKSASPHQYNIGVPSSRPTSSSGIDARADFATAYSVDEQPSAKRQKIYQHPRSEPFDRYDLLPVTELPYGNIASQPVVQQQPFGAFQFVPAAPPTPGPSVFSDDSWRSHNSNSTELPTTRDLRRLSVKSIMNSPVDEDPSHRTFPVPPSNERESVYGLDQGLPDLDIPRNDDSSALIALSPKAVERRKSQPGMFPEEDGSPGEFGFGLQAKQNMFERGEYYANPVVVRIPKSLEPLPDYLIKNPMNLLYFHHFLNHTARMLVPHDCPENPFRNLLPGMAMQDIDLLNLLLAYSACHRARLLNHPDPSNRIAMFVEQVFPNLRIALKDPNHLISNSNLATSIMLASLEIISPQAFDVQISWQEHLTIARQMIVARGGYQTLHREDDIARFLSRWFAYLDVVGSLSGIQYLRPLDLSCLSEEDGSPLKTEHHGALSPTPGGPETPGDSSVPDLSTIDCLIGCTGRCVMTLAKVADLAKQCDAQRIGLRGTVNYSWRPSSDVVAQAEKIQAALKSDSPTIAKGCIHHDNNTDTPACGMSEELIAVNGAFHLSGLIHLYRRVLVRPKEDPDVQQAVRGIADKLDEVRRGGSAEACLIFPMFTAGCEAIDLELREKFLKRLDHVETYGMMQVHRARTLMQKVWDTGRPWETLATTEFVG